MKILFIHHSGLIGGAGVSLLNTVAALEEAGHEILLTLPGEPADMRELAKQRGITPLITENRIGAITYVSGIDKLFSPRFCYRVLEIFRQWKKWNRRIREVNPDVVIVNSKTLCWMSALPAVKERKSICFVRETTAGNPKNPANRWIAKRLDQFTAVSFLSKYDETLEQLKKAKTAVIHNYVQPQTMPEKPLLQEKQENWGLCENRFRVLYAGGVSSMKGFHIAVEAVLKMGQDAELIVAGSTFQDVYKIGNKGAVAYAEKMEAYLREKDLHGQIHLIGKQQDMAPCYSLCDVLLFPMQKAHQARPAFEAGFYGKPVVISDFENIREFVRNGENGLTVPADDISGFTQALNKLKNDRELCTCLGSNNRENTQLHHSVDAVQAQIKTLIGELFL